MHIRQAKVHEALVELKEAYVRKGLVAAEFNPDLLRADEVTIYVADDDAKQLLSAEVVRDSRLVAKAEVVIDEEVTKLGYVPARDLEDRLSDPADPIYLATECNNDGWIEAGRVGNAWAPNNPFETPDGWSGSIPACDENDIAFSCTSGFTVTRGSSVGLLTAGHCLLHVGITGAPFDTYNLGWANSGSEVFTTMSQAVKAGAVNGWLTDSSLLWRKYSASLVRDEVYRYSNLWYDVSSYAFSDAWFDNGMRICLKLGQATWNQDNNHQHGNRCGTIRNVNDSGDPGEHRAYNWFRMEIDGNFCAQGGDSGAPAWQLLSNGTVRAMGILTHGSGAWPCDMVFINKINHIAEYWNVTPKTS